MVLSPVLKDVLSNPGESPAGIIIPSQLAGLQLWCRFNQRITVAGSGVSQWDDQSGNGNHLLQATDTNRPSLEADGTILFDGVDNYLKAAAFTLVQPETVYFLGKTITYTSGDRLMDGHAGNSAGIFQNLATTLSVFSGTQLNSSAKWVLDNYHALAVVFNGASSSVLIDNGVESTGNAGASNMGGFTLGAWGTGSTAWGHIQVKEVLVYNTVHTAAEKNSIINYLQSL